MSLTFPNINPIIVHIWGPLSISWYSLAYVAGVMLGWLYFKHINKKHNLEISKDFTDELVTWSIFGIIIGGRVGYVLFYDFITYLDQPLEILKTWRGGMSFHGGVIGLTLSIFIACRYYKTSFLKVMDIISCVAPLGIFFGRIANFINGELYGRPTDVAWGIIFPTGGNLPLHPSQLYEAVLEGVLILITQYLLLKKTKIINYRGILSALFLIQYGIYRFIIEFFREPDSHLGFIYNFTMGQILSIPLFVVAAILITFRKRF